MAIQFLRVVGMLLALTTTLFVVQANAAPVDGNAWTGTWMSNHGELRLIQDGDRVYGDFGNRGMIEARIQPESQRLRGTFQNPDSGIRDGYFEFTINDGTFTGRWGWPDDGRMQAGANDWKGLQLDDAPPRLRTAVRERDNWPSFWNDASPGDRAWVGGGSGGGGGGTAYLEPAEASDIWTGTFHTNFGELRLVQIGRRVYGDYADLGFVEGCAHGDGTTLRGTFQYNRPANYHGFFEFRTDGDGFAGVWTWTGKGVPRSAAKIGWRGVRVSAPAPSLRYVDGSRPHFANSWPELSAAQRKWVLGSDYYDSCDPPDIQYDD